MCKYLTGIAAVVLTSTHVRAVEPPRLLAPSLTPAGWQLTWTSPVPDQAFTVLTSDRPDGLWVMAPADAPWPRRTNRWVDPRPARAARFYRVLAVTPAERGKVLATSSLGTYLKAQLNFLFQLAGIPVTAQYDVTALAVTYETVGPWGGRTQASGVMALPSAGLQRLPLVSYQHGTLARKSDAPSQNAAGERIVGLALAATGYLALLPDYLGLGDSPGIQAYHHARSEGTAGVDLLRAARTLAAQRGVNLNGQLFLLGYSHGGHATMALLRELETFHADEFPVTAAAPMAGAYDLSGVTAEDFLSPRPKPNPYYLALLLAAYQDIYRLAPSLADLLAPPYHTTLPPRLTGQHTGGEINAVMPADPTEVLRQEVLSAFQADPSIPYGRRCGTTTSSAGSPVHDCACTIARATRTWSPPIRKWPTQPSRLPGQRRSSGWIRSPRRTMAAAWNRPCWTPRPGSTACARHERGEPRGWQTARCYRRVWASGGNGCSLTLRPSGGGPPEAVSATAPRASFVHGWLPARH